MLILLDLAGIAFFLALILSPLVRDASRRAGWVDRPDEVRKIHRQPIPRVGGVAIIASYLATLGLVFVLPYQNLPFDLPRAWSAAWPLLPALAVVFATGLIDDLKGLNAPQKFSGQILAAGVAYWAGFGIDTLGGKSLDPWIAIPVTIVWLVGCSNALNLIDGMDGLAAGVGFFATATMLIAALIHDQLVMAIVTAPLLGALLGFLRYNFNPASLFLGDSGSLTIGFLLGCYGAQWTQKSATVLGMTAPLIALSVPLLDTGLAIVRRFLRNKPIFSADRSHIHHKLLERGWTTRQAALVLYGVCGVAAGLSLLYDTLENQYTGLVIVLFCAAAWLGVQHLGYAEFGMASRLLMRGQLRGIIDVQVRLQGFERALREAESAESFWEVLETGCRDFDFAGARLRIGSQSWASAAVERDAEDLWQLRMPLDDGQYLNLYRQPDSRMHPVVLARFGSIVEEAARRTSTKLAVVETVRAF